jgi:hypothetical protein
MKKLALILMLMGVAGFATVQARADTLASLVGGGSLSADGLTYSNFSASLTGQQGGFFSSYSPTSTGNVQVNTLSGGGQGFSITGGFNVSDFSNTPLYPNTTVLDLNIKYQVTSLSPIDDIGLSFNAFVTGPGLGFASVTETVHSGGVTGPVLAQAVVTTPSDLSTELNLSQDVYTAWVTKDIQLQATDPNTFVDFWNSGHYEIVTLSEVDQTFSTSTVPEPSTILLFGLGLLGIGFLARRRQTEI